MRRALKHVTDDARSEARRRGHPRVHVAHLALASLSIPEVVARFSGALVSTALLRERLDAELARIPSEKGYREGSEAVLDDDARRFVEAASPGAIVGWFRSEGNALARAIRTNERLTEMLASARWDETKIRKLHSQVVAAARASGAKRVRASHALVALLDDPVFARALAEVGANAEDPSSELRRVVARDPRKTGIARIEQWLVFASLTANLYSHRELRQETIVVDLLRITDVQSVLAEVGVDGVGLLTAYVHKARAGSPELTEGMVEVVFTNDDYTTQEVVVGILQNVFELEPVTANATMLEVHRQGEAVVAVLEAADAKARIERALATCAGRLMPLRIVTRPVQHDLSETG